MLHCVATCCTVVRHAPLRGLCCKVWQAWPDPSNQTVPFGLTRGVVETGTDHARAPLLEEYTAAAAPDAVCAHGIRAGSACCAASCGRCGGADCARRRGGAAACCVQHIEHSEVRCAAAAAPCIIADEPAPYVCLFDLEADPAERQNLAADPQYSSLITSLTARLKARADAGPDIAIAFPLGQQNRTAQALTCKQEQDTGYLEPVDWARIERT